MMACQEQPPAKPANNHLTFPPDGFPGAEGPLRPPAMTFQDATAPKPADDAFAFPADGFPPAQEPPQPPTMAFEEGRGPEFMEDTFSFPGDGFRTAEEPPKRLTMAFQDVPLQTPASARATAPGLHFSESSNTSDEAFSFLVASRRSRPRTHRWPLWRICRSSDSPRLLRTRSPRAISLFDLSQMQG